MGGFPWVVGYSYIVVGTNWDEELKRIDSGRSNCGSIVVGDYIVAVTTETDTERPTTRTKGYTK